MHQYVLRIQGLQYQLIIGYWNWQGLAQSIQSDGIALPLLDARCSSAYLIREKPCVTSSNALRLHEAWIFQIPVPTRRGTAPTAMNSQPHR